MLTPLLVALTNSTHFDCVLSPVVNTNATIYGYPQYFRMEGKGTLNVQWNGTNETASAPAIWEVMHTH